MNEQMHGQMNWYVVRMWFNFVTTIYLKTSWLSRMDKRMDGRGISGRNEPTNETCKSLRIDNSPLYGPNTGQIHEQHWIMNVWCRLLACMGPVQYNTWQIGSKTTAIDSSSLGTGTTIINVWAGTDLVEVKTAAPC